LPIIQHFVNIIRMDGPSMLLASSALKKLIPQSEEIEVPNPPVAPASNLYRGLVVGGIISIFLWFGIFAFIKVLL